ncbi:conserved hypothetical protein [Ricinus communis]|uniref:Uncharacterized protein n=1 Tax=Ricinus communis TaxID=3988 RepID=B9TNW7_RICCO|nr:conserved hypothetical protein [Ricinus communis]
MAQSPPRRPKLGRASSTARPGRNKASRLPARSPRVAPMRAATQRPLQLRRVAQPQPPPVTGRAPASSRAQRRRTLRAAVRARFR